MSFSLLLPYRCAAYSPTSTPVKPVTPSNAMQPSATTPALTTELPHIRMSTFFGTVVVVVAISDVEKKKLSALLLETAAVGPTLGIKDDRKERINVVAGEGLVQPAHVAPLGGRGDVYEDRGHGRGHTRGRCDLVLERRRGDEGCAGQRCEGDGGSVGCVLVPGLLQDRHGELAIVRDVCLARQNMQDHMERRLVIVQDREVARVE